jgi:hypothetical protein
MNKRMGFGSGSNLAVSDEDKRSQQLCCYTGRPRAGFGVELVLVLFYLTKLNKEQQQ